MPKRTVGIPLSRMTAGLNRFDLEAGPDQCVDALDVHEDYGDLRRRPAFHSISTGAPFLLPAGSTIARIGATIYYDRVFSVAAGNIGGTVNTLSILCREPFNGIEWAPITASLSTVAQNSVLSLRYLNAQSVMTQINNYVDSTRGRFVNGSNVYYQTLCKEGRISWHTSGLSWGTETVGGRSWYRVDLNVWTFAVGVDPVATGALSGTGNVVSAAPGPRAFILEPVRSIFPVSVRNGRQEILVGSDRQNRRGTELGAQIGVLKSDQNAVDPTYLVHDEGSGTFGAITWPTWYQGPAGGGGVWRTDFVDQGGGPITYGTNLKLTKHRSDYSWEVDGFRGALHYRTITPSSITNNATEQWGTFSFTPTTAIVANQWEHFRLRCTVSGGGPAIGEEREIYANTTGAIFYHPHFSALPTGTTRFDVYKPHMKMRSHHVTKAYECSTNAAHTFTPPAQAFSAQISNGETGLAHWELCQELPWRIKNGDQWDACFDPITKQTILTNGESGLLTYDGRRLRQLTATSVSTNARVQLWTAQLQDLSTQYPNLGEGSKLDATPPTGRFVQDFNSRLVVTGLHGDPYGVKWSAPGTFIDLWPKIYREQIRDSENQPPSGMATLNDQLYVFTPTSIHASGPADEQGFLRFTPVAQGVGFVSNRAVDKISYEKSSALIGPAADGVYIFTGTSAHQVLDDWRRLIPLGVNKGKLSHSVGAMSLHRNWYFLAVASNGQEYNDRVLLFDVSSRAWWVWSAPFGGVTSIARDFDDLGRETMLFGSYDGHVSVLVEADDDDGYAFTGRAKGKVSQPAGGMTMALEAVVVVAEETGSTNTLGINSYVDRREDAKQSFAGSFNAGANLYGASNYSTNPTGSETVNSRYASNTLRTRKIMFPAGTRAETYQFEISGTHPWRFRSAELIGAPRAYRSR